MENAIVRLKQKYPEIVDQLTNDSTKTMKASDDGHDDEKAVFKLNALDNARTSDKFDASMSELVHDANL